MTKQQHADDDCKYSGEQLLPVSMCVARAATASRCVSSLAASRASSFPTASLAAARTSSNLDVSPKSTCHCQRQPNRHAHRASRCRRRRIFVRFRVEKEGRERLPKGAEKARAGIPTNRARPPMVPPRAGELGCSGQAKDCRGEYFCTAHCRARGWPPPIGWGSIFRLTRAWRAYLIFDPQKRTAQGSRAILTWQGIANVLGASSSGQAF